MTPHTPPTPPTPPTPQHAHSSGTPTGPGPGLMIIGGGVMGSAVARGAVAASLVAPARLTVVETDPARARAAADLGWTTAPDPAAALALAQPDDPVLLAVKPQSFDAVADAWRGKLRGRLVLSIMAGIPSARLATQLGPLPPRIVRIMSNTPARLGRGCTAIAAGPGATPEDLAWCDGLCRVLGPAVVTIDEPLMDAFTAVAGSGPAYLFLLAESMTAAAVSLGLSPSDADLAVRQTLLGSAALLAGSADAPEALRAAVTSRGGTTAAAVRVLESAGFQRVIGEAITAARDRGRELSNP